MNRPFGGEFRAPARNAGRLGVRELAPALGLCGDAGAGLESGGKPPHSKVGAPYGFMGAPKPASSPVGPLRMSGGSDTRHLKRGLQPDFPTKLALSQSTHIYVARRFDGACCFQLDCTRIGMPYRRFPCLLHPEQSLLYPEPNPRRGGWWKV